MFVEGRTSTAGPTGNYLVEIISDGPRHVAFLSEKGAPLGWSADGRFLAIARTVEPPFVVSVLDVSPDPLPVPVAVPPRSGRPTWSRTDGRYALVTSERPPESLVVVDATTTIEKVVELPVALETSATWSFDGRYVVLAGSEGLALIDTSGTELTLRLVHDDRSFEPLWSADSRYFVFEAYRTEGNRLLLFDTLTDTLELLVEADDVDGTSVRLSFAWAGNTSLIYRVGNHAFFLDLREPPLMPIPLAEFLDDALTGKVSPGNECYAYRGRCDATGEEGICVKTLPADPGNPSVLVQHSETSSKGFRLSWAGTGDQLLLLAPSEPWLVNVELDGGDLTSRFVTEGTDTKDVYEVVDRAPIWNPSGRANWIVYVATLETLSDARPRLWNRETGASYDAYTGGESADNFAWSPDGRYLLVRTDFFDVQEILDRELGRRFRLNALLPAPFTQTSPFCWQP